eukprot:1361004-Amorphochlora_amoeboformis.AAC.2
MHVPISQKRKRRNEEEQGGQAESEKTPRLQVFYAIMKRPHWAHTQAEERAARSSNNPMHLSVYRLTASSGVRGPSAPFLTLLSTP